MDVYCACMQAPNPSQTQSPCLSIDPHCTECSNNVCTACNIIFTLDNSSKKCGEQHCLSDTWELPQFSLHKCCTHQGKHIAFLHKISHSQCCLIAMGTMYGCAALTT